jgi:tight adherence protein B
MGFLVLGFVSILSATFALVLVVTRRSPFQQSIDRRMSSIQSLAVNQFGTGPNAEQLLKTPITGRFSRLEEMVKRYQFSQRLQTHIMQANSSTTVTILFLRSLALSVAGYGTAWLFTRFVVLDIAMAIALGSLPYGILNFTRSRRINAFNAVLAESIDMLARALRAGYSMVGAIEMLSENAPHPAAAEFREIFKQQNLGLPLRDALLQLLDRVPSLDLRVLVTAILVQKDTGGNLAEILDRTVCVIRERLRIQGEIRVHTAQGRLTGWILSALPIVMLVLINVLNPGYSSILLHDPYGQKLLYLCAAMLMIGAFVIRWIVNGIEV